MVLTVTAEWELTRERLPFLLCQVRQCRNKRLGLRVYRNPGRGGNREVAARCTNNPDRNSYRKLRWGAVAHTAKDSGLVYRQSCNHNRKCHSNQNWIALPPNPSIQTGLPRN